MIVVKKIVVSLSNLTESQFERCQFGMHGIQWSKTISLSQANKKGTKCRLFWCRWIRLGAESCSGSNFQIWLKVNTGTVPVQYAWHTMVEDHKSVTSKQKSEPKFAYFGAGGQTWTGTVVTPQDFKSCASADSATPAYWRHHSDSNWGMRVLQTRALPLGYGAISSKDNDIIT